jgi:signal transduction histidine kinase
MFEIQGNSNSTVNSTNSNTRLPENNVNPFSKTVAFHTSVLNGMSHEMRTQMNAIVALAFLMKDDSIKETERENFINQIYSTCDQLINLFENYLESAIVDAGSSKNEEINCNLNNLLDNLLTEFREILRKGGKQDIELVTEIQFSDLPDVVIDKAKVYRILRCLFHNSIQNTNSGYIKIGYFSSKNNITFYVLDSGQGFSKTNEFLHTNNLTDSLSQYQDLSSAVNITLAKKLIHFLHGSVSVRCNGTSGTGIHFSVPVRQYAKSDITLNKYVNSVISS